MSIYKPSLLDKFKDFVNGLKSNWDQYEDHVEDFETAKGIITDTFDETRTYAVGDYAIYENVLYKCVEAIEEAGEWDADKWAATNIAEEFKSHLAERASDDVHGLSDLLKKFKVIAHGEDTGVVVEDMALSPYGIYLLGVGRDHGLYFITCSSSSITISNVIEANPSISISTDGLRLSVDFSSRNRSFVLISLFERD